MLWPSCFEKKKKKKEKKKIESHFVSNSSRATENEFLIPEYSSHERTYKG